MSDTPQPCQPYRVLARKYRPQNFEELIGQDALVRTLKNAIESGRIAHAFMLTGIRGTGKTTTARIIAKALNYTGPDGKAGPTTGDTSDCRICQAITEDRHPDVIEMDAASRTGVDDIREILEGVRYAPTEARYKVYVIDEVHMLSKNAFNALLKTLEEPPEHVKFIFATTEIRKVPITVLSRCQRFDLARVDIPTLSAHFKAICDRENVVIDAQALNLIARAADGSVRDGLSLLDRAIALSGETIDAGQIKEMLGLADKTRLLDLLESALSGDMPGALEIMDDLYKNGMDPVVFIQDLLDLTHALTRLRAVPASAGREVPSVAEAESSRAGAVAEKLSMPTLARTWQLLLKGLGEVQMAPNPQNAAEMVLIRLVYGADLPDPATLIKKLTDDKDDKKNGSAADLPHAPGKTMPASAFAAKGVSSSGAVAALLASQQEEAPEGGAVKSLEDIVSLLEENGEPLLAGQIYQYVHLVKIGQGFLEVRLEPEAPQKLSPDLKRALETFTGERWVLSISNAAGRATLAARDKEAALAAREEIMQLPIIKEVFALFPDAEIKDIKPIDKT